MKIGDLARQVGVTVETVRYYENERLLPPPERTASNYRTYGPGHADRVRFIVNCRALDMTLDEIRQLLTFHDHPTDDCAGVNRLLEEHISHVDTKLAELRRLQGQLRKLRRACSSSKTNRSCGILQSLQMSSSQKPSKVAVHGRARGT